jgi:hypothetical protein
MHTSIFIGFFILCFIPCLISESDCTALRRLYKGCAQSSQQLVLSQLMHSTQCGSALFPYQENAGLHNLKDLKALHDNSKMQQTFLSVQHNV